MILVAIVQLSVLATVTAAPGIAAVVLHVAVVVRLPLVAAVVVTILQERTTVVLIGTGTTIAVIVTEMPGPEAPMTGSIL